MFYWSTAMRTADKEPEYTLSSSQLSEADPSALDYSVAFKESYGFFDDIPKKEWDLIKDRVQHVYPTQLHPNPTASRAAQFFAWLQMNYEPDFACRHERRVGSLGDGGKVIQQKREL